ncbi:hypothetical protein CEQ21_00795 [Niallia circulans]|uniref:Uncharacterized protein n=1 Tax=Niallia circulans TaxID=1397 RepID=A0A553SRB6_NIACI|nr:hypothetical protein CEQ21_00795 [Niallia circulans]
MENINGKVFLSIHHDNAQELLNNTIFHFTQDNDIVSATFYSKSICYGELVGLVNKTGILHVIMNLFCTDSTFSSGTCDLQIKKMDDIYILSGNITISSEEQLTKEIILQEITPSLK